MAIMHTSGPVRRVPMLILGDAELPDRRKVRLEADVVTLSGGVPFTA